MAANKTPHTPGPWEYHEEDGGVFAPANERKTGHCWTAIHDAERTGGGLPSMKEQKANARLIAAAPELLALVKRMTSEQRMTNDDFQAWMDGARAAILKATEGR